MTMPLRSHDVAALPARPRRRAAWHSLRMATSALALGCACLASAPTSAQIKENNDYYASAGTELLRSVNKYHIDPLTEKLRTHQYQSASGDLGFTFRYFPNHPQGLVLLMQLCEQWQSAQCAPFLVSDIFERAIAANPNVAATYVLQGIYLYRVKRLPAATASLERALVIDPDSLNAHYNLGLLYFDTKQYELANAHAQRAYQLGAEVPGLRDKLMRAGKWKPLDTAETAAVPPGGPDAPTAPVPREQ